MTLNKNVTHYNVYTLEEFGAPTQHEPARQAKSWTKIGATYPHSEGAGFSIALRALPLDGRLVILPAEAAADSDAGRRAGAAPPRRQAIVQVASTARHSSDTAKPG